MRGNERPGSPGGIWTRSRAFVLCLDSGTAVWRRAPGVWLTVIATLGPGPGWELFFRGDQCSMFKANKGQ